MILPVVGYIQLTFVNPELYVFKNSTREKVMDVKLGIVISTSNSVIFLFVNVYIYGCRFSYDVM